MKCNESYSASLCGVHKYLQLSVLNSSRNKLNKGSYRVKKKKDSGMGVFYSSQHHPLVYV